MCVLRSSGNCSIQPISQVVDNSEEDWIETNWVASRLLALGYRDKSDDPLLPAVAKFWYDNSLGNLTVFPEHYATRSLAKLFRESLCRAIASRDSSCITWNSSHSDLAFVVPSRTTRTSEHTYGTRKCASLVRGGGHFIMRESSELVQRVLHRMGFIDGGMNACLEEGVDVFASCSLNARALRKAGLNMRDSGTLNDKINNIRKVFLSNSFSGSLQLPPSDVDVRRGLFRLRLLPFESAPADEVFDVMASHLISQGTPPKRTYNGRVLQLHNLLLSRLQDPSMRQ